MILKGSTLATDFGLQLNNGKSEVICKNNATLGSILVLIPGLHVTDPAHASLLGAPIGGIDGINKSLTTKTDSLRILGDRLGNLQAHDAFCLLRNAFSLPKLMYILRSSPCFTLSL